MRSLNVPWLSSKNPNLESQGSPTATSPKEADPPLTQAEVAEMFRPRHMSESYTSFDLPLKSDPELLERYVNAMGGFREWSPCRLGCGEGTG
jgi:acyl-coenzyme A thioesterase 9